MFLLVGNIKISLSKFFGTPILSGALFCLVQAVAIIKKTISIAIANNGILFSCFHICLLNDFNSPSILLFFSVCFFVSA